VVSGVFSIPLGVPKAAPAAYSNGEARPALPLCEFISGEENALVRVAAEALLRGDAVGNPLLFYGETGVGKSHLCLGLLARWKHAHPQAKALAIAASDFARAYASSIDADALDDFRRKYRRLDLLLVENLAELAEKEAAQRELIAALDELDKRGRRVLVTANRLPAQIDGLAHALVSRLSAGLQVPLVRPSIEPRRVILERLAAAHRVQFSAEALDALAEQLVAAVPGLNHAVVTLAARAAGGEVGLEHVEAFLADGSNGAAPTLRVITARVARYFKLRAADLKGPTRRQAVVQARGVAMYLARQLTGKSLDEVGRHYGGRDHTTVLHACRKTETLLAGDPATRQAVDELKHQLTH
jgi:chromosomal replication initiator protein